MAAPRAGDISEANPTRFEQDLRRWRDAVAAGGITRSVVELGYLGHTALNRETLEDEEPTATPIVRRGDIDPVQLRILNRILARATTPDAENRYADPTELLADVEVLLETTRVPASRRAVLGRLAQSVRTSRRGAGDVVALLGPSRQTPRSYRLPGFSAIFLLTKSSPRAFGERRSLEAGDSLIPRFLCRMCCRR